MLFDEVNFKVALIIVSSTFSDIQPSIEDLTYALTSTGECSLSAENGKLPACFAPIYQLLQSTYTLFAVYQFILLLNRGWELINMILFFVTCTKWKWTLEIFKKFPFDSILLSLCGLMRRWGALLKTLFPLYLHSLRKLHSAKGLFIAASQEVFVLFRIIIFAFE